MYLECREIMNILEKRYPRDIAEDYDNVGLLLGNPEKKINKILICLEINSSIIEEAKEKQADLIVTHHPLIFKPIKKITEDDYISSMIIKMIREDINVYALHTNFDNAFDGMNDILANKLELKNTYPLSGNMNVQLYKFVIYVPVSHAEIVRKAIFDAGAGHIGNYSHCSFNEPGMSTFMPEKGSCPFIGNQGELERVEEIRIETIVDETNLPLIINTALTSHPYEEAVYNIIPLKGTIRRGAGRCGILDSSMKFEEFCGYVKDRLSIPWLKVTGNMNKEVKKVAVLGGSGEDFIYEAADNGCDVIITGDIRHHHAVDALQLGINVIDGGHYFTEVLALPFIAQFIKSETQLDCFVTEINTNPFAQV